MWTAARRIAVTGASTAASATARARLLTTAATTHSSKAWSLCRCSASASLYRSSTLLFPTSAATAAVARRALHSAAASSLRSPSLAGSDSGSDDLPIILTPLPTAASFDAPLPTLAAPERIDPSELIIDESCVKRLRSLAAQAGHPVHLRVLVDQGGCSGLEYKFRIEHDDKPEEDDIVVPAGVRDSGVDVWVDRDSWLWLRGSRIEYQVELARSAFVVASNPNATQACGCKSSFAPKVDPRIAAINAAEKAAAAATSAAAAATTTASNPAQIKPTSQL